MKVGRLGVFLTALCFMMIFGSCPNPTGGDNGNDSPVIESFTAAHNPIMKDSETALKVEATDPDGDSLTYAYKILSGGGTLGGSAGGTETYTAPNVSGSSRIQVTVIDPDGLSDQETLDIEVVGKWEYVGTGELTATLVAEPVVAVHSDGTAYYAFRDTANGSGITVLKYTGNTTTDSDAVANDGWEYVGSPNISGGTANDINLALDGTGTPYIAYRSGSLGHVQYYNGSNWVNTTAGDFGDGWSSYISLFVESAGIPWVAFKQGNKNDNVYVLKQDGAGWLSRHSNPDEGITKDGITEDFTSGTGPRNLALVVDGSSKPYVVFKKKTTGEVCVLEYTGDVATDTDLVANDGWEFAGAASALSSGDTVSISMDVDSGNNVYVAYRSLAGSFVKKYSGISWSTVGGAAFTAGTRMRLAVEGTGNPYVIYQDNDGGSDGPSVKVYNSSGWVHVGLPLFESAFGFGLKFTSICFDGSGIPFVTYSNSSGLTKGRVRKYVE